MAGKDIIEMSQRELRRLHLIHKAIEGLLKQKEASACAARRQVERDGITVNDETLRKWLMETGDWKKIRKSRKHRQWRERKHHIGEMIQIDGSNHDWFEGRGPECVLMGYIDDATGKVYARFYGYEGTMPAMDSFKRYVKKYGIPVSAYLDKHTTYKSPKKEAFPGYDEEPLSQFERAMTCLRAAQAERTWC